MEKKPRQFQLPKMLELSESPLPVKPNDRVILQPKYDGAQAIIAPLDEGKYVAVTRSGLEITRLTEFCEKLNGVLKDTVLFTEYEPVPWSEGNKSKLAGNLYTTTPLNFGSRLVAFDQMNFEDFMAGKMRTQLREPRLIKLEQMRPDLSSLEIETAPYTTMSYKEAHELCRSSRFDTEEGVRCALMGVLCEGGVITAGTKAQKDKAKVDMDIAILAAVKSGLGQRGWVAINTKNTKDWLLVYGGVTPENHQSVVGKVVEVELLAVSKTPGAGNPTFTRSRENEKTFDVPAFIRTHKAEFDAYLKSKKVVVESPGLDLA